MSNEIITKFEKSRKTCGYEIWCGLVSYLKGSFLHVSQKIWLALINNLKDYIHLQVRKRHFL